MNEKFLQIIKENKKYTKKQLNNIKLFDKTEEQYKVEQKISKIKNLWLRERVIGYKNPYKEELEVALTDILNDYKYSNYKNKLKWLEDILENIEDYIYKIDLINGKTYDKFNKVVSLEVVRFYVLLNMDNSNNRRNLVVSEIKNKYSI